MLTRAWNVLSKILVAVNLGIWAQFGAGGLWTTDLVLPVKIFFGFGSLWCVVRAIFTLGGHDPYFDYPKVVPEGAPRTMLYYINWWAVAALSLSAVTGTTILIVGIIKLLTNPEFIN